MTKKSSRTALSYFIAVVVFVFIVMASFSKQSAGAATRMTTEEFEERPHTVTKINETPHTFHKEMINGRIIVCCYVNPLYQGIVNNDSPRSFENIDK